MNGNKKYLKEKYLEARDKANPDYAQLFTIEQLYLLKDMAREDVVPDGRFSDLECNVWELFKRK